MGKASSPGLLLIAIFVLALCMPGSQVAADEVIERFETAITVNPDSSVEITETISVNVEGEEIQRGIFRDIPTVLRRDGGGRLTQALEVLSVTRNGAVEPYTIGSLRNGKRIRIGDAGVMLPNGTHTYELTYRIERAARMFQEHDELYWNATGNFWAFPILEAMAVVTLPEGAEIRELDVFTGARGATEKAATVERLAANVARFEMSQPLGVREGMTFAVAFDKGALTAPGFSQALRYWLSDYRGVIMPIALVLSVLGYYCFAWYRVGRGPARGVIIPRFYPPEGLSPALTHFVYRLGRWEKGGWNAFSAALVSLATKGLVSLREDGRKAMILETTGKAPESPLPSGEKVVFDYLDGNSPVRTDGKHGAAIYATLTRFVSTIQKENRAVFFKKNRDFVLYGMAISGVSIFLMIYYGVVELGVLVFILVSMIPLAILAGIMKAAWRRSVPVRFVVGLLVTVLAIKYVEYQVVLLSRVDLALVFVSLLLVVIIILAFRAIMGAPTVHGRKVLDEIEGFKMYLETAEKERLNFQGEPDMSVPRYEAILPYAMALGVEKPWSERFENDLTRHAVRNVDRNYRPHWYQGGDFTTGGVSSSMSGVATGIAAAMVAARPASSSSSGFSSGGGGGSSSGGGSSGGGGGGGGGGGW